MSSVEYGVYRKWFDWVIREEKPHVDLIGAGIFNKYTGLIIDNKYYSKYENCRLAGIQLPEKYKQNANVSSKYPIVGKLLTHQWHRPFEIMPMWS
jgi:hypothetical protein